MRLSLMKRRSRSSQTTRSRPRTGCRLVVINRYEEALACHDRALELDPKLFAGHVKRATYCCVYAHGRSARQLPGRIALRGKYDAHFNSARLGCASVISARAGRKTEYRWKKKGVVGGGGFEQPV